MSVKTAKSLGSDLKADVTTDLKKRNSSDDSRTPQAQKCRRIDDGTRDVGFGWITKTTKLEVHNNHWVIRS